MFKTVWTFAQLQVCSRESNSPFCISIRESFAAKIVLSMEHGSHFSVQLSQGSLDWRGRVQETFNCQYLVYGALLTQTLWQNMLQQPLSPFPSSLCPRLPLCRTALSCINTRSVSRRRRKCLDLSRTTWRLPDLKVETAEIKNKKNKCVV